jgi:hypothetical protein
MSKLVEMLDGSRCSCATIDIEGTERTGGAFLPRQRRVRDVKAPPNPNCLIHGKNPDTNYGTNDEKVRSGWRPFKH